MSVLKNAEVISSTPERTRLRVAQKFRDRHQMARIAKLLEARPNIRDVRTNVQTGSVVVHHEHRHDSLNNIAATLHDLGIILETVTEIEVPSSQGKSGVAADLTSAIADLNQRVGETTNGVVDLRMLVPMGLGVLALRQLLRNGWQIEAAPWYVLAYYAFDSFIKLHYTQEPSENKRTE